MRDRTSQPNPGTGTGEALPSEASSTDGFPAEARIAAGALPQVGAPIPSNAPTPGLAFAAPRVPTAPTLPDPQPTGLGDLISTFANALFVAPPSVPTSPDSSLLFNSELQPQVETPASPTVGQTTPTPRLNPDFQSPQVDPAQNVSPFHVPLHFEGLTPTPGIAFSFPLLDVDVPSSPSASVEPSPVEPSAFELRPFQIEHLGSESPSSKSSLATSSIGFDPHFIRQQFPILHQNVNGKPLVWLDNAATTQKPQQVIDRLSYFYENENSNIHRAAHTLAARATEAYENARESVRRFINAPSTDNIVFVRGATEGINLVAQSWGRANIKAGDEIIVTWLEHHANIVPWQQLCAEKGAHLRVAPVDDTGQILLGEYAKLFSAKTRLVAMTQVSNALGTITPAHEMIAIAHGFGVRVLLDGAQAVSHKRVDVQALDADFYVFSGHKVFAPTGIGAVYAKRELLESMPPWQGGGNMIQDVTFEKTIYHGPPARFEAGTGNIADAVGLGEALDWLTQVGIDNVEAYEHGLLLYGTERLRTVPGLTLIGTALAKAGVLSFVLEGQETTQVGGKLDKEGVAVRSGHHCAQPILRRFGVEATVRASLAPYNTFEDIDALVHALHKIQASRLK